MKVKYLMQLYNLLDLARFFFFFLFSTRLVYLLRTKKSEALNRGDILLLSRSSLAAVNIKAVCQKQIKKVLLSGENSVTTYITKATS